MGKKARVDAKGSWAGMNRGAGVEESEEALGAKGVRFEPRLGVVFQGRAFAVAAAAAAAAAAASAASAAASGAAVAVPSSPLSFFAAGAAADDIVLDGKI